MLCRWHSPSDDLIGYHKNAISWYCLKRACFTGALKIICKSAKSLACAELRCKGITCFFPDYGKSLLCVQASLRSLKSCSTLTTFCKRRLRAKKKMADLLSLHFRAHWPSLGQNRFTEELILRMYKIVIRAVECKIGGQRYSGEHRGFYIIRKDINISPEAHSPHHLYNVYANTESQLRVQMDRSCWMAWVTSLLWAHPSTHSSIMSRKCDTDLSSPYTRE